MPSFFFSGTARQSCKIKSCKIKKLLIKSLKNDRILIEKIKLWEEK